MIELITKKFLKKNIPQLSAGDTVKVHLKVVEGKKTRIQIFEGLVIKVQNGDGINGSFTVRKISSGVGVERNFPLHSPVITKIEKTKSGKVRRSRLYYMRERSGRSWKVKGEKREYVSWEEEQEKEVIAGAGDLTQDESHEAEVSEQENVEGSSDETPEQVAGGSSGDTSDEPAKE